jgi:hypothetical protein
VRSCRRRNAWWHQAGVGAKLVGSLEAGDAVDLQGYDRTEHLADAGKGAQAQGVRVSRVVGFDALFERAYVAVQSDNTAGPREKN